MRRDHVTTISCHSARCWHVDCRCGFLFKVVSSDEAARVSNCHIMANWDQKHYTVFVQVGSVGVDEYSWVCGYCEKSERGSAYICSHKAGDHFKDHSRFPGPTPTETLIRLRAVEARRFKLRMGRFLGLLGAQVTPQELAEFYDRQAFIEKTLKECN